MRTCTTRGPHLSGRVLASAAAAAHSASQRICGESSRRCSSSSGGSGSRQQRIIRASHSDVASSTMPQRVLCGLHIKHVTRFAHQACVRRETRQPAHAESSHMKLKVCFMIAIPSLTASRVNHYAAFGMQGSSGLLPACLRVIGKLLVPTALLLGACC
jgi:hypothetical protein